MTPGPNAGLGTPAPSDAVVLLGEDTGLNAWQQDGGGDAAWVLVEPGVVRVQPGTGTLATKQSFGDCQLHIEWMCPGDQAHRTSQNRGNSGVFLMGLYELQVLSSYHNDTYADGMAAAIYGQHPPRVNASRPMGQWQSYDITFRRPRFDAAGNLMRPARMTVFHNGLLVHDHVELVGPASHMEQRSYEAHADALPLKLQDHGEPVHFRNIWIRALE
ncbi:MAG: DUF1080 domain-containing protein [Planctomycetota bacterium]